jgi:hypothetical protein
MTSASLPGLPGSSAEEGCGAAEPAALDGLLQDAAGAAGVPIGTAPSRHRELRAGPHPDLLGPVVVPAGQLPALREQAASTQAPLPVLLAGDLDQVRAARAALFDDDRLELVGVVVPLPPGDPGRAARDLVAALDLSVPAWIAVPPGPGADAALRELVADGAEHVTVDATAADDATLAGMLRRLVDDDLTFRVSGSPGIRRGSAPGLLNLLCAVRAALNGAEPAELAVVLAQIAPEPLVSAVRRMSTADAAVTRAFLAGVEVPDPWQALAELDRLGLLPS